MRQIAILAFGKRSCGLLVQDIVVLWEGACCHVTVRNLNLLVLYLAFLAFVCAQKALVSALLLK